MEQDCVCPNHVQCDIVPFSLTSEVVLPSYQHFLEREHHLKGTQVNESEALIQFGKTILMLILARVNGYYSPYTAQTIKKKKTDVTLEESSHMLSRNSSNTNFKPNIQRLTKEVLIQQ